jgi:MerR family mercuric resistance operon transcriptional regulator
METLTIGRVASRAGIGIETIRFYERQALIDAPPRSAAGYRQYPENTILRLRFIRRAKELGFSLKEIKELLILHSDPKSTCSDIRQRAEKKLDDINGRIFDLKKMRDALELLLAGCSSDATSAQCPILQALTDE